MEPQMEQLCIELQVGLMQGGKFLLFILFFQCIYICIADVYGVLACCTLAGYMHPTLSQEVMVVLVRLRLILMEKS